MISGISWGLAFSRALRTRRVRNVSPIHVFTTDADAVETMARIATMSSAEALSR
jgi:hypothetical protein